MQNVYAYYGTNIQVCEGYVIRVVPVSKNTQPSSNQCQTLTHKKVETVHTFGYTVDVIRHLEFEVDQLGGSAAQRVAGQQQLTQYKVFTQNFFANCS